LAAKLLGWRIDIKSEEEKRQEVESQMAAVVPGAPVSVLVDHGLTEAMVEKLMAGGVNTVESLGSMTPEDLEAVPGIDPATVEAIQTAVNSYYGQFEGSDVASEVAPEETADSASGGAPPDAEEANQPASAASEPENESVTIEKAESVEGPK
jgi:N utilization substance protein A